MKQLLRKKTIIYNIQVHKMTLLKYWPSKTQKKTQNEWKSAYIANLRQRI